MIACFLSQAPEASVALVALACFYRYLEILEIRRSLKSKMAFDYCLDLRESRNLVDRMTM